VTRLARVGIVALVVLALGIELFVPQEDTRTLDATTYGTMPWGYRAVHDLLVELGAPAERFHDELDRLPTDATAWWITPPGLCLEVDDTPPMEAPGAWIDAGGTGIVFLPDLPDAEHAERCRLGDVVLPSRAPQRAGGDVVAGLGTDRKVVTKLDTFTADDGWTVRARVAGEPFVLERAVGRGRLVAVADARILQNANLTGGDTALVAVDLVRAFGAPRFVEAVDEAGLSARSRSAIAYLVRSPAIALFAGLVLTGLLAAWGGNLVPPRTVGPDPIPAPTLQTFVTSLARLYAGSHDYARLLARYRDATARRLRRHFGMAPTTPLDAVAARVERARPALRDARAVLVAQTATTQAAFDAAVARLDALATEVIG
jgi:hypothetical protein